MANDTINIYLTQEERRKIDKLKVKYQLSLTAIVDVLLQTSLYTIIQNEKEMNELGLTIKYTKGSKTSIKKPRLAKNYKFSDERANISRLITNLLKIYINHDAKKYAPQHFVDKFYSWTDKELQDRYDPFWNYNQYRRNMARMIKEDGRKEKNA